MRDADFDFVVGAAVGVAEINVQGVVGFFHDEGVAAGLGFDLGGGEIEVGEIDFIEGVGCVDVPGVIVDLDVGWPVFGDVIPGCAGGGDGENVAAVADGGLDVEEGGIRGKGCGG